jgi:hypothetical protein
MQWLLKRWIVPASIATVIALYALLGFLLVPKLARDAITEYVQTDMQRKISIAELTFNPFTFTAEVKRFALTEADDTPIASFDALMVNAQFISLFHRGATFKEIRIDNPSVLVRVEKDGSLNLAKLAPSSDQPIETGTTEELPRIRIDTFAINQGQVRVEDQSRPRPFAATLTPIQFSLSNFRTEPKFGNEYRFAASTDDQESLEWSGEFTVQPLGSTGRFILTNIKAQTIAAYLQDALPFHLPSGLLDLQGEYRLAIQERIDLQITLPQITARDFALSVRTNTDDDASVEQPAPWIVVPQLSIADTSLSLADRKLTVGSVMLGDAKLDVWREPDGSINLTRLFTDGTETTAVAINPAPTEPPSAPETPWTIGVKSVAVERAHIDFADKSVQPNAAIVLTPVNVKVTDYSNATNAALTVDSNIGFDGKGEIDIDGPVVLSPLAADLSIAIKKLDLTMAQPYIAQSTDMTLHSGLLSTQSFIGYVAEPPRGKPQLKLTGDIEVQNLLTKDNALKQDFIKWQSLKVSGLTYQQNPDRLAIARVQARKPYGRVIISEDGTVNVSQILSPPRNAPAATSTTQAPAQSNAQSKPMPIRINSIAIDDGSASFADYSVNPSFATEIGSLKGSVTGLSSDKNSRAKVQLAGSVDQYAPVSITGDLNMLATDKYSDIAMSFRNIELTTFNPYSGKFAGYNISKGKLTTEMQYKVENRSLNATHKITIDQLEFGDATESKDAVSLPIKLAVALLKDRHGVINLDLPISGNLDDPQFRVGPIVWQVLKNTLEKIVTAPFAMLGSLFGGGEELSYVDFATASATLSPTETEKLNKLRTALIERPQLRLDIPLQATIATDRAAMTQAALEDAVIAATRPNSDRLAALATVYAKEFGKPPVYPDNADKNADVTFLRTQFLEEALLDALAPSPAQLDELARSRGNAVRDALLANGEVAAERVFLTGRPAISSPDGAVRLELKLE